MRGAGVNPGDIVIICAPTSPHDGKRAKVIDAAGGYNVANDAFELDFMTLEMVDTGIVGGIHRRFVSEVQ